MNPNTLALLASAVFSLMVGFILLWISLRGDRGYFVILNPMSWLIIGLFPVFLIFAFFPTTTVSGTILGVSITGAGALFLVIWKYGIKWTKEAYESRQSEALTTCLAEKERLQAQIKTAGGPSGPVPYDDCNTTTYHLKKVRGKKIGLVTGNIENVQFADIWVSPENTNMEMARHFDRSVSGAIRYLGSKRNVARQVVRDLVARELKTVLIAEGLKGEDDKDDSIPNVGPATVLVTGAGELSTTHNVKKVFHVAAVQGDPAGGGYRQVPKIESCITETLERAKQLNDPGHKSILFPLLGTGTGKGDVGQTADKLIRAAVSYLEHPNNRTIPIEAVYFLAWSDVDLAACQAVLNKLGDRVTPADS